VAVQLPPQQCEDEIIEGFPMFWPEKPAISGGGSAQEVEKRGKSGALREIFRIFLTFLADFLARKLFLADLPYHRDTLC